MIIDTGFESYELDPLEGQFGWLRSDLGNHSSTAVVQNSIAKTGSQAVLVTRGANSDVRWAIPKSGFPTQRYIIVDWDMRVAATPSTSGFGPFFGVDTYDADVAPFVLGTLGVDARTGEVLYQIQDTGLLTATGTSVAFDQWNHYRIVLDFATDTFTGLVNGAVVATTGFVDRVQGLDDFTDADIAGFSAGSAALTSSAVFDNFLVRDGLLGDYNNNGNVDSADYDRWRATLGTTESVAGNNADGNGNGVIDAADYVVWRNNVGTTLFSPLASGASLGLGGAVAAVPEPASAGLTLMVSACLAAWCRRRAL
jgi:hypothetical protein